MLEQSEIDWYVAMNRDTAEGLGMVFLSNLFGRRFEKMTSDPEFWNQEPSQAQAQYDRLLYACTIQGDSPWSKDELFNRKEA